MKYVISIFIFFMITGWTSNIGNQYTEAAGNYKIGEIKYIANDCTNITCTDELISPNAPLIPGSLTSTEAKHTTVGGPDWSQKYNNEHPFREHNGIDRHINSYNSSLTRWVDPEQLECMALNIYFESAVEPLAGKLAVSQVVLNRVNARQYPSTVCEVIKEGPTYKNWKGNVYPVKDRCQFSWWCDGKVDVPHPGRVWENSKKVAKLVMTNNRMVDITEGSTHYHAEYITPRWASRMNRIGRIGAHYFYKNRSY